MRKFLKDGTEFRGLEKTLVSLLKYHQDGRKNKDGRVKLKEAASTVSKVFRLSEDFDSDDSDEEEHAWLLDCKKISKQIKELVSDNVGREGKYIKLLKY